MKAKKVLKYIILSIMLFLFSVIISILLRNLLLHDLTFYDFTEPEADLVVNIINGAVSALAISFVLYQLNLSEITNRYQATIEEAQFILNYNQTFIQDSNMSYVESELEKYFYDQNYQIVINDDNKQKFINYLVYLESFAPLILSNIIKFDHMDDLMAYRYFIAVNNPYLQKAELFKSPEYYRGCFKMYRKWVGYRESKKYPIPLVISGLDKWEDFEKYADIDYKYVIPNTYREMKFVNKLTRNFVDEYDMIRLAKENNKIMGTAIIKSEGEKVIVVIKIMKNYKTKGIEEFLVKSICQEFVGNKKIMIDEKQYKDYIYFKSKYNVEFEKI